MADILAVANVLFAGTMAVISFRDWWHLRIHSWSWLKLAHALIGLYGVGLYIYVLVGSDALMNTTAWRSTWIRPFNTVIFAILLAGSLARYRRPND